MQISTAATRRTLHDVAVAITGTVLYLQYFNWDDGILSPVTNLWMYQLGGQDEFSRITTFQIPRFSKVGIIVLLVVDMYWVYGYCSKLRLASKLTWVPVVTMVMDAAETAIAGYMVHIHPLRVPTAVFAFYMAFNVVKYSGIVFAALTGMRKQVAKRHITGGGEAVLP